MGSEIYLSLLAEGCMDNTYPINIHAGERSRAIEKIDKLKPIARRFSKLATARALSF